MPKLPGDRKGHPRQVDQDEEMPQVRRDRKAVQVMLADHPVIRNVILAITCLSVVAGATGVVWNFRSEALWAEKELEHLAAIQATQAAIRETQSEIRAEQARIQSHLELQTADLEEIRTTQIEIIDTARHRFELADSDRERILSDIRNSLLGIAVPLGRLLERLED